MCSRVANRNAVMYVVISMIYLLILLVLKFIHFLLYWFLKPEAAVKQISSWVRVHEIYSYLLSTWCVIWREYRTCSWQRTVFLGKMASSGRYKEHCRAKVLLPGWNLCWCLFWGIRQSSTFLRCPWGDLKSLNFLISKQKFLIEPTAPSLTSSSPLLDSAGHQWREEEVARCRLKAACVKLAL